MPRIVRMPTEQELPMGAVREFVEALFALYREAWRPTLREISNEIERSDSAATASPATIRRMLRGTTVPSWQIVNAVVLALCRIANVEPDAADGYDELSRRELVQMRWNQALDHPEPERVSRSGFGARAELDPWASAEPVATFSDEPPF